MGLGLGLHMIIKKAHRRFMVGLIFAGIMFGASCLKKTDLQVDDLGATVAADDIASALGNAFGPINYNDMKPNEFSSIVVSQKIQDGAVQNIEQQDVTLTALNNQPNYLEVKSRVLMTTFTSAGNVTDERDWDQFFQKYSGFAFMTSNQQTHQSSGVQLSEPFFTFMFVQSLALTSCDPSGAYPENCYALSVNEIDYKVPANSAQQHGCADQFNCYIKAQKVEFDQLLQYKLDVNGKPHRIHHSFIISQAVPFTARVLEYCTRSLYDIDGVEQKILADICYKVNRYGFGN